MDGGSPPIEDEYCSLETSSQDKDSSRWNILFFFFFF